MERARTLPVRGQGLSNLEQERKRTGQDQPLSGRDSGPRRRRRLQFPILISSCRLTRTWSTTVSRPSTCSARTRRGMRTPGPGRPTRWVTGPPGGSCSATPSSYSPRNTDSGTGPISGRTSRARALPATGRSPACGGPGSYASWADALLTELRRAAGLLSAALKLLTARTPGAEAHPSRSGVMTTPIRMPEVEAARPPSERQPTAIAQQQGRLALVRDLQQRIARRRTGIFGPTP